MSYYVKPMQKLIEQFESLPGIGKKTAQRLAYYVLNLPAEKANEFAEAIKSAQATVKRCKICQNLCDTEICGICSDSGRDITTIRVVEDPKDVISFEKTREYNGLYHVLHGLISPMSGIGPQEICIK